jgi:hypothetical protein
LGSEGKERAGKKKADQLELLGFTVERSLRNDPCYMTRELLDEVLT